MKILLIICLCLLTMGWQEKSKAIEVAKPSPSITTTKEQSLQLSNLILSADKLEAEIQAKVAQKQLVLDRARAYIKEMAREQKVDLEKYQIAVDGGGNFVLDDNGYYQFILKKTK